jgi:hypothetical protein
MGRKQVIFVLSFCCLIGLQQTGLAEMYKWTNPDGSLGFTDDPAKVPEQYRNQGNQRRAPDSEDRIYYGKPTSRTDSASPETGYSEQKPVPEKQMSEEEKKKLDAELRAKWEAMKKALSQGRL